LNQSLSRWPLNAKEDRDLVKVLTLTTEENTLNENAHSRIWNKTKSKAACYFDRFCKRLIFSTRSGTIILLVQISTNNIARGMVRDGRKYAFNSPKYAFNPFGKVRTSGRDS
jgi:hypothetical protein